MNPTFPDMHPDLTDACVNLGVTPEQVSTRYSDVYVMCATHEQARKVCEAGKWRSMAEVFRTNPEHPDAKLYPWGVDVPFAFLGGYIAERKKEGTHA